VPGLVEEDAPADPRNVYAATKLAQEHLAGSWARATGSRAIALRYHNVYGPGMPRSTPYSGVAALFRSAAEEGRAPEVFEDGAQARDFVHVHDVARANALAIEAVAARATGRMDAYNVCSGHVTTVLDVALAVAQGAGSDLRPVVTGRHRPGDVRHVVASPDRARTELGFVAEVRPAEGLRGFAHEPLRD
jgi:dTDP-L-rhamnose 4-epimerase